MATVTREISNTTTNMAGRIASSAAGIPIVLFLAFAEGHSSIPALPWTVGVVVCSLIAAYEFYRAAAHHNARPLEGLGYLSILLLQIGVWGISRGLNVWYLPAGLAFLALAMLLQVTLRRDPRPLGNLGITLLGIVYTGYLLSYLSFIRALPGEVEVPLPGLTLHETARGAWLALYVFAVSWSTDSGGFFIGRRWGKRAMAPQLSPNKTWEGALGGLAAGVGMSVLWGGWIQLPLLHCLGMGVLLAIAAQMGDLCASALKRDFGVKDFGALLPGHGGLLDRFDSILFTAPVAYYYMVWILGQN